VAPLRSDVVSSREGERKFAAVERREREVIARVDRERDIAKANGPFDTAIRGRSRIGDGGVEARNASQSVFNS
jgi:hypothetical protein